MRTYNRSLYVMIKGIISAPFSGLVVYIILNFFVDNQIILLGAAAVVTLLVFHMSVFSSRISFTLSDAGEFCYYKKGKLENRFDLTRCSVGYNKRTDGNYIYLKIVDETGNETSIDAEPLGSMRFMKMYNDMTEYVNDDEVLKADNSGIIEADKIDVLKAE